MRKLYETKPFALPEKQPPNIRVRGRWGLEGGGWGEIKKKSTGRERQEKREKVQVKRGEM